jgi:hypothetical protein
MLEIFEVSLMVVVTSRGKTISREKTRGIARSADAASKSAVTEIEMEVMVTNPELWSPEVSDQRLAYKYDRRDPRWCCRPQAAYS